MTTRKTVIRAVGLLCGLVLLGFGVWFLFAPSEALQGTSHLIDRLPAVMAGRYFFFGAVLIAALLYDDPAVLAFLLAGFAALGFYDSVVYLDISPLPHLSVGIVAALASLYFFSNRKVAF